MKKLTLFLFLISFSVYALDVDPFGYYRMGTGTNSEGGDQECFSNPGIAGNPFRLGNECGIYSEFGLVLNHKKKQGDDPFFKGQFRFAYEADGHTSYESQYKDWTGADKPGLKMVEAFVEAGNFGGTPYSYWIGKRFYRESDFYMNDWYYYGYATGNGAGIGDIPVGKAKLYLAQMREISTSGSDEYSLTLWDVRLKEIPLSSKDHLEFWFGFGTARKEGEVAGGPAYDNQKGEVLGARYRRDLDGGFNQLAVMYGRELMQSLDLYGATYGYGKDANRLRIVEHLSIDSKKSWGVHFGASYESLDKDKETDSNVNWYTLGIQPIYYVTDNFHITGVLGHSDIKDESDGKGHRKLTRITVSPQLNMAKGIWERPSLRCFYTYSSWSKGNVGQVAGSHPFYKHENHGSSFGFQVEGWF